jgi:hypothetical protein
MWCERLGQNLSACGQQEIQYPEWRMNKHTIIYYSFTCVFVYTGYAVEMYWKWQGKLATLRKATITFVMSVSPRGITRLPLNGFSWDWMSEDFLENRSRKFGFHWNLTNVTGTLHENQLRTYDLVELFLELKMFLKKSWRQNHSTHFTFSYFFSPKIVPFMR